jgi:hypothetical protein
MISIANISLNKYFSLTNEERVEYDFAMKYAFTFTDSVDEYAIGDIIELPFGIIKDIQFDLEHGLAFNKLLEYIKSLIKKDIMPEPLNKICRFGQYLVKGVEEICEYEKQTLAYEAKADEEQAGIEKFNGLGVYMQIRSLTGGDVTKYDQVRALPYSLCFTELYTAKQLADYQNELNKITREATK